MRRKRFAVFFSVMWLGICLLLMQPEQAAAADPVVSNVLASQRAGTKFVDITYDVADADGNSLNISVQVSDDSGTTYNVPASHFTGDYGAGITPGTGKKIVWDAPERTGTSTTPRPCASASQPAMSLSPPAWS